MKVLVGCEFSGIVRDAFLRLGHKPDQIIQPWQFGHPESKATCLWLRALPRLRPTRDVRREMLALSVSERNRVHHVPPSPSRWKERSRTLPGIASAMAAQWGAR